MAHYRMCDTISGHVCVSFHTVFQYIQINKLEPLFYITKKLPDGKLILDLPVCVFPPRSNVILCTMAHK